MSILGDDITTTSEAAMAVGQELRFLDSSLNLTVLRMVVSDLPEYQLSLLLHQFNVSSIDELLNQTSKSQEKSYEEQLLEFPEYRMTKHLLLYIPPVLLIFGIFGNIVSFLILMRRSMRKLSTYVYLAVLSVTDTLILLIGLLPLWIGELTDLVMRDQSDWICKLTNVAGYTASDYSVWLIIAVTVERYIAVCHPLKAPTMCSRRRAVMVIILMLLTFLLLNIHFFWTVEVHTYTHNNDDYAYQCEGTANFTKLVQDIWPWVDAFLYSFLPFVVISVINSLIIHQVVQAHRSRSSLQSNIDQRNNRVQETSLKLTMMLLTISFAFLLTTLPMNISLIGTAFYNRYSNDLRFTARFKLVRTITELLMYLNHSMNFYLYCATGQKFRQQLLLLFCHKSRCLKKVISDKSLTARTASKIQKLQMRYDRCSPDKLKDLTKKDPEYIPMKLNHY